MIGKVSPAGTALPIEGAGAGATAPARRFFIGPRRARARWRALVRRRGRLSSRRPRAARPRARYGLPRPERPHGPLPRGPRPGPRGQARRPPRLPGPAPGPALVVRRRRPHGRGPAPVLPQPAPVRAALLAARTRARKPAASRPAASPPASSRADAELDDALAALGFDSGGGGSGEGGAAARPGATRATPTATPPTIRARASRKRPAPRAAPSPRNTSPTPVPTRSPEAAVAGLLEARAVARERRTDRAAPSRASTPRRDRSAAGSTRLSPSRSTTLHSRATFGYYCTIGRNARSRGGLHAGRRCRTARTRSTWAEARAARGCARRGRPRAGDELRSRLEAFRASRCLGGGVEEALGPGRATTRWTAMRRRKAVALAYDPGLPAPFVVAAGRAPSPSAWKPSRRRPACPCCGTTPWPRPSFRSRRGASCRSRIGSSSRRYFAAIRRGGDSPFGRTHKESWKDMKKRIALDQIKPGSRFTEDVLIDDKNLLVPANDRGQAEGPRRPQAMGRGLRHHRGRARRPRGAQAGGREGRPPSAQEPRPAPPSGPQALSPLRRPRGQAQARLRPDRQAGGGRAKTVDQIAQAVLSLVRDERDAAISAILGRGHGLRAARAGVNIAILSVGHRHRRSSSPPTGSPTSPPAPSSTTSGMLRIPDSIVKKKGSLDRGRGPEDARPSPPLVPDHHEGAPVPGRRGPHRPPAPRALGRRGLSPQDRAAPRSTSWRASSRWPTPSRPW